MLFSKIFLLVSVLFFSMSNDANPTCKAPETNTEFIGMGLLVTGITSLAYTMRQALWDFCKHVNGKTDAEIDVIREKSLKKMYIRLAVGTSITLTGLLFSECRIR